MKELLHDTRVQRLLIATTLGSIGSGITIFAVSWLLVKAPDGNPCGPSSCSRWRSSARRGRPAGYMILTGVLLMALFGVWQAHGAVRVPATPARAAVAA